MRHYYACISAVMAGSLLSVNAVTMRASSIVSQWTHRSFPATPGVLQLVPRIVRSQDRGVFLNLFGRSEEEEIPEEACRLAVRSRSGCGGGGGDEGGGGGSADGGGGEGSGGWEPSGGESIANSKPEVLEPQTVTITANRPADLIAAPAEPIQVAAWDINLNGHASSSGPTSVGISASWTSDDGAASLPKPNPAIPKPVAPKPITPPTPKKPKSSIPKKGGGRGGMIPRGGIRRSVGFPG